MAPVIPSARVAAAPASAGQRAGARPSRLGPARRPQPPAARRGWWSRLAAAPWPLALILAAQAAGSLRLLHADTAFQDEALYLWAGHLEWSHWLHGTRIPLYSTYFSGAPVLYPPLGALAARLGGLAGARLLSLGFMLAASTLLWGTAARLYGRRAAFFATAIWACLGPTLHLGSFATYDAMALCLVALAAWCATRAAPHRDETGWMAATAAALALANATKYASALFDPVVVAIVILSAWRHPRGAKAAYARGAALAAYTTATLILLVMIGGGYYEAGIGQTTLTRLPGYDSPLRILHCSWDWTGPVLVAALAGVLIGVAAERSLDRKLLLAALAVAATLAPLEQARIHTLTSLDKHVDFGAWFAAIAAGYAADRALAWIGPRWWRLAGTGLCLLALTLPARAGLAQSIQESRDWPNAARFTASLSRLIGHRPGRVLVETPSIPEYYLHARGAQWKRWSSTRSIFLPSGHSISGVVGQAGHPAVYAAFVRRDYFRWIALDFYATPALDRNIAHDLRRNPAYRVVARVPYGPGRYIIWACERQLWGAW
jgi:4-amino-4-deoxy-L-arabinose transferase-like glycosyltransferase